MLDTNNKRPTYTVPLVIVSVIFALLFLKTLLSYGLSQKAPLLLWVMGGIATLGLAIRLKIRDNAAAQQKLARRSTVAVLSFFILLGLAFLVAVYLVLSALTKLDSV